jgi:multicomponent Na+:H+ antiporter subunit D
MAVLFFVAAMSLAGVPPLSGFWPKVIVVQASLAAESYIIAAAALVTGFLTLYSMAKVWALAFWRSAPESGDGASLDTTGPMATAGPVPAVERRAFLMAPVAVLAAASVAIGLWAQPLLSLSERAAAGLITPDAYVEAVLGDGKPATGKEE